MNQLTANRDTPERKAKNRRFTAGSEIFAGSLVACNTSTAKAVPAADAANLVVVGRAEHHANSGEIIHVATGCFAFASVTGDNAVTVADLGNSVYVADDQTVSKDDGTNAVVAGKVFDADDAGIWIVID